MPQYLQYDDAGELGGFVLAATAPECTNQIIIEDSANYIYNLSAYIVDITQNPPILVAIPPIVEDNS